MKKKRGIIIGLLCISLGVLIVVFANNVTKSIRTFPSTTDYRDEKLETFQSSKGITVEYPAGYTAKENGDMLIISNGKGAVVAGGFRPADGRPDKYVKGIMGQEIMYTRDPKIAPGSMPTALYYRSSDTETRAELVAIVHTIEAN